MSKKDKQDKHVYLHISVRAQNRGYAYRAVAQPEGEDQISLEGWASGSEKEVRKTVQQRIEKVMADRRSRALKRSQSGKNNPPAVTEKPASIPAVSRYSTTLSGVTVSYSVVKKKTDESGD